MLNVFLPLLSDATTSHSMGEERTREREDSVQLLVKGVGWLVVFSQVKASALQQKSLRFRARIDPVQKSERDRAERERERGLKNVAEGSHTQMSRRNGPNATTTRTTKGLPLPLDFVCAKFAYAKNTFACVVAFTRCVT